MDEKAKQELSLAKEMTEQPGWGLLVRDTKERMEAIKMALVLSGKSEQELFYARGAYDTMNHIVRYADNVEAALTPPEDTDIGDFGE